jgi:F1F0 ATPase subunit 2
MMMNEILIWILAAVAGVALGGFFFGGLWWTVRRGLGSTHPVLWFVGGGLLRMSIVLAGFYLVSAGQWERLLICLAGFLFARLYIIWLTRPSVNSEHKLARVNAANVQENNYAP